MEDEHVGDDDVQHGEDILHSSDCMDFTSDFIPKAPFGSRDDAVNWVQRQGCNRQFVIVTKNSDAGGDGRRGGRVNMACERSGSYRGTVQRVGQMKAGKVVNIVKKGDEMDDKGKRGKSRSKTGTKKCGCPFAINIKEREDHLWHVTVVCGRHHHDIGSYMEGHSYAGRLDPKEYVVLIQMTKGNIKPRKILDTLKKRDKSNASTLRTIYNARQKHRLIEAGGRSQMQQLMHLLETHGYISWHRKDDQIDEITDLFWAHPKSINLLRCFPLVLMMDYTYKTNRYRMQLLEIIGVTSTELTFSVEFSFISRETEENYIWELKTLKNLMDGWSNPHVILTDRELGLMKAIEFVFPSTTHLLCTWHINRGVAGHTKKYFARDEEFNLFLSRWNAVMVATSESVFNSRMTNLATQYACVNGLLDYLMDTWVRDYKERFVRAWTYQILHLGHNTTGRVESAHNTLKKHIENSQGNFVTIWPVIHSMVEGQHNQIKVSFEKSLNVVQHGFVDTLYRILRGFVSHVALEKIRKELDMTENIGTDSMRCGCVLRMTHGLPCAHELATHQSAGSPIPLDDIHVHWQKLSMNPEQALDRMEYNFREEIQRVFERYESVESEDLRMRIVQQLREISRPSSISIIAPKEKIKTSGRKPTKAEKGKVLQMGKKRKVTKADIFDASTKRNPSHFEHVLHLDKIPNLATRQVRQKIHRTRTCLHRMANDGYSGVVPIEWIDHIARVDEVRGDGNCGYRVVATGLGHKEDDAWKQIRNNLYWELHGYKDLWRIIFGSDHYDTIILSVQYYEKEDAPFQKWMSMPDMGLIIATCYKVLVVSLSPSGSMTFPPLRGTPLESMSDRVIIGMTHVNGNHFMRVLFNVDAPFPPLYPGWRRNSQPEAMGWVQNLNIKEPPQFVSTQVGTPITVDLGTP